MEFTNAMLWRDLNGNGVVDPAGRRRRPRSQ